MQIINQLYFNYFVATNATTNNTSPGKMDGGAYNSSMNTTISSTFGVSWGSVAAGNSLTVYNMSLTKQ